MSLGICYYYYYYYYYFTIIIFIISLSFDTSIVGYIFAVGAFSICHSLTQIFLTTGLSILGLVMFGNSGLVTVTIPSTITYGGEFYNYNNNNNYYYYYYYYSIK